MKTNKSLRVLWILFLLLVFILILFCYFKFYFNKVYVTENNLEELVPAHFDREIPELHVELKPNASIMFEGLHYRISPTNITINSGGFRDYEYDAVKPNNTFRILSFGDSYAFGWGVELNDTYAKLLERKLKQTPGKRYQVLNFGVFGYNTKEQVMFLEKKGLDYEPDIVLISFLGNDIEESYGGFNESTFSGRLGKKLDNSRFADTALVQWINRKLYQNMFERLNKELSPEKKWQGTESAFSKLANLSDEYNFSVAILLFSLPYGEDVFPYFIENIVEKNDFNLVDLQLGEEYYTSKYILNKYDGHPNKILHGIYADSIYDYLIENGLIK